MPTPIHGDYVIASSADKASSKHVFLSIDARELRTAILTCRPLSLGGANARAHGTFACMNKETQGRPKIAAFNANIRLRKLPGGQIEVSGLDGGDESSAYLPAAHAIP